MASSLNRAQVIGNLTRDPELRQTTGGQSVCSFGVATNRTWKDASGAKQEAVEYHNIVAWGKLAEICSQFLKKGRKTYVEGRLQTRDWEGQDGVRRFRTEIVADNMILLDRPGTGAGTAGDFSAAPSFSAEEPSIQEEPAANPDDEIKIEDIPF
ncbi:MAG: single-stranded DNA-binding protein [Patescibacteria group bacterium]|nr:single-stranded DNA-binding protein [Patescibacteria group bacterium]